MEEAHFQKIQSWFETLNNKVDKLVTHQQFENRFQALFTAMQNLLKKVESYKNQQDEEITLIKRAIHDIEEELRRIQGSL